MRTWLWSLACSSSPILTSSSAGSFSSSARSAACCFCRSIADGEPLLGVGLALAPFGLLAPGGARPLAVGRGLARLGRRFGALVGDGRRRRCRASRARLRRRCSSAAGSGKRGERTARPRRPLRARPRAPARGRPGAGQGRRAAPRSARAPPPRHRSPAPPRAHRARPRAPRVRASSAAVAALLHRCERARRARQPPRRPPLRAPGSSSASSASRLARSSRSAAAAPAPIATKPSQRRSRPSRVTSRWPTASGWPVSSSATATCLSRRSSSRRRARMVGEAVGAGGQCRVAGERHRCPASGAGRRRRSPHRHPRQAPPPARAHSPARP